MTLVLICETTPGKSLWSVLVHVGYSVDKPSDDHKLLWSEARALEAWGACVFHKSTWSTVNKKFIFHKPSDAMLFVTRWHGQPVGELAEFKIIACS